jgi:hypothetical protein
MTNPQDPAGAVRRERVDIAHAVEAIAAIIEPWRDGKVLRQRIHSELTKLVAGPAPVSEGAPRDWQAIETAPKMRTILLFAVSDVAKDGTAKNWTMATGSWHTGYEDVRSKEQGFSPWNWGGRQLKVYELHPTHWMPLPLPPTEVEEAPRAPHAPQERK